MDEIVHRTARGMAAEGHPFTGTLFAGLMIKDGRAKLLEHNVRFGDPECQTLMARTQGDLTEALLKVGGMRACAGQGGRARVLVWDMGRRMKGVGGAQGCLHQGTFQRRPAPPGASHCCHPAGAVAVVCWR